MLGTCQLLFAELDLLLLQLRLLLQLLQLDAELLDAQRDLGELSIELFDLGMRLGAQRIELLAQLRDRPLADVAGRGLGRDPDFGNPGALVDDVSLLDGEICTTPPAEAVARIMPLSGTSQPVTVVLRA